MRLLETSLLATALLTAPSFLAAVDLQDCVRNEPESWSACLEEFDLPALKPEELRRFDALLADAPRRTLAFLELLESRIAGEPALSDDLRLRAVLFDQEAVAYRLLGNEERSAELALEALETDTGARTLDWWSPDGDRLWSAELDAVGERREVAARALLQLGRKDEARALLAAALGSGATGEVEALWAETGGGAVGDLDAKPVPIHAGPWYPRLPSAQVPMVEGEPFVLADALGQVLILDFWASWCKPCLKELPALGELYESEKNRGLQVLLINMGEAPEHAHRFARDLGLKMPVGIYDEALDDAFGAATLPTMIIADRDGRVRARWDGYGEGIEKEVAEMARRLLGPEAYDPGEPVGQTLRGGTRLRVEWARTVKGSVDSLSVLRPTEEGAPGRLLALAGRHVLTYDWRGVVADFADRPRGSGLLRTGDLDGDGRDDLFTFRPGSTRIARLDLDQGRYEAWESPSPLLDLAVVPKGGDGNGSVFLATVAGLRRISADGETFEVYSLPEPTGLAALAGPEGPRLGVGSRDRGVCILDPAETEEVRCHAGSEGWRVVAGLPGTGLGSVPRGAAAVFGRILGGENGEVAAITSSNQLVIVDAASGQELFRARLDGLRALAAGDLDGDGGDELAVAVGDRLLVLQAVPVTQERGPVDVEK